MCIQSINRKPSFLALVLPSFRFGFYSAHSLFVLRDKGHKNLLGFFSVLIVPGLETKAVTELSPAAVLLYNFSFGGGKRRLLKKVSSTNKTDRRDQETYEDCR